MRVAPKTLKKMKDRIRKITSRSSGKSMKMVITELRRYLLIPLDQS